MWCLLLLCIVSTFASNNYEESANISAVQRYSTRVDGKPRTGYYHPFFPVRGSTIGFAVKSERDAYVALTMGPDDNNPMFEILFGAYTNNYLYIRKNRNPETDIYVYTDNILSSTEYRSFWIQLDYWNDITTKDYDGWKRRKSWLNISVGYGGHAEPLITRLEENPINIEFFGISSWGVDASWEIRETHLVPQRKTIYAETPVAEYPNYNQFIGVTQKKIRFRVQTQEEAYIVLTSGQTADNNTQYFGFFEIVLGRLGNTQTLLKNKLSGDFANYTTWSLLNQHEYRWFWIELNSDENSNHLTTARIRIGGDNHVNSFIDWKDPHPMPINYYSFATTKTKGKWVLEEITEPPVFEGQIYVETANQDNFYYEQFFKVTSKTIWFKVRSGNDASIALTSKAKNSWPMYQINIEANKSKKITVKCNDTILKTAYVKKSLVEDEYRKFRIKFETVNNSSQQGPTVQIWVGYENEDISFNPSIHVPNHDAGFEIKYYSIATLGNHGSGFWILEDSPINQQDRVNIKKLYSEHLLQPFSRSFRFFPVYSNVIEFKVRAGSKACITLTTKSQYAANNTLITFKDNLELLNVPINTISKNDLAYAQYQGDLLSSSEYRGFWIKFSNITQQNGKQAQLFRVGRMDEVPPFLAWVDEDFYPINYFGINIYDGSSNSWIIKTKGQVPQIIQYDEDIYTPGDGHIKFYPMTGNFVKFKVQASRDAVIFLLPSNNDTSIYIKIVLGQNKNTESTVYRNGEIRYKINSGLLHPTQFREFWISWSTGNYLMKFTMGRVGELPALTYFSDLNPFDFKYIGLTTPPNVTGTWSIPEFFLVN